VVLGESLREKEPTRADLGGLGKKISMGDGGKKSQEKGRDYTLWSIRKEET